MGEGRQANEALVELAYAAIQADDAAALAELFAPDARLFIPESLPFGGAYLGLEHLRLGLKWRREAWAEFASYKEQVTSWADRVVVLFNVCGRSGKTGLGFAFPAGESWRVKDGRIVELRTFYYDTHRMVECYGQ